MFQEDGSAALVHVGRVRGQVNVAPQRKYERSSPGHCAVAVDQQRKGPVTIAVDQVVSMVAQDFGGPNFLRVEVHFGNIAELCWVPHEVVVFPALRMLSFSTSPRNFFTYHVHSKVYFHMATVNILRENGPKITRLLNRFPANLPHSTIGQCLRPS